MFYIYFLKSQKDNRLYTGKTNNLVRRLYEHNSGQVTSTKSRRPLILMGYVTCNNLRDSIKLEKEWKKGYKREILKKQLNIFRRGGRVAFTLRVISRRLKGLLN